MSNKLIAVLDHCLHEGTDFILYVEGSRYGDTRRLIGYKIGAERKVTLGADAVSRFAVKDFTAAMIAKKFDFITLPVEVTTNNFTWKLGYTGNKPHNAEYIRRKAENGVAPQADKLQPQLREFTLA